MIILEEVRPESLKLRDRVQDACLKEARAWKPMPQQHDSLVLHTLQLA